MNKIIKELKNKSLLAYILSFSAIIIFIVIIMGTYLYWFYYRNIYRDFKSANQEYIYSISAQHENNMQILDNIMMQLSLSGNDAEFLLQEYPQKSIKLKDTLYQYLSVSQFFDRIFYFYHKEQFIYNPQTSIHIERFLSTGIILEKIPADTLRDYLYKDGSQMIVLPEQGVSGYLVQKTGGAVLENCVFYALTLEPKRNSTVFFLVGEDYYNKLLGSKDEDLRGTSIFYKGKLIISRGTSVVLEEVPQEFPDENEVLQYEINDNGEKYLITWHKGESDLVYCTVQSVKIFQDKIASGQWGIFMVLAICSIPTSLVFWGLSRSLSGKVRNINTLLGVEEIYNLDRLESGIRTLTENRNKKSEESLILHRTRFISDFIRDKFLDRDAMLKSAKEAKLDVDKEYFVVALMGDGNSNENESNAMMLRAISEYRGVDGYGIHLISNNQSLYAVFANTIKELEALLEEFFVIGKNSSEEFVMSVSDFHENFDQADTAYLEADSAYGTRLLVDNSRIICFKDMKLKEQLAILPDTYLQRLKNAIRLKRAADTKRIIQEICESLRSSRQSLLTFRIFCNDIIHMLIKEWAANTTDYEDIYNVFSLSQCLTINDFHDMLWEVSSRLMSTSIESEIEAKEKESDFVEKAIGYMKENYQDSEFNMSALAELLGVSGVTLAVKFKNSMEISPSSYMTIMRMEQAKKLLRETNMQVKEVSQAVGYGDARVFMRRFKKYTGKTPLQYKSGKEMNKFTD